MTFHYRANIFKSLKKRYKLKPIKNKQDSFLSKTLRNKNLITRFVNYYNNAPKHRWINQPWYYGTGLHYSNKCNVQPITSQICGGALNHTEYENTLLFDHPVDSTLLDDISIFPMVRSKITTIESNAPDNISKQQNLWHSDETPFEVLRVIVPLETSDEYLFQLDNCEPVNLKVGMIYAFDQSIPHRIFKTSNISLINRTHLILSYVTWFNRIDNVWVPNNYANKLHPLEIFLKHIDL